MVASRRWFARIHPSAAAALLPVEGELPALDGATGWLNSPPLGAADLAGKVVLVDFWTYTCINWLRTLPYVRAWAGKYAPHGLVVIGVHTPEFEFEHDADNVRRAVQDMRVSYPVAIDNDYAVWGAFRSARAGRHRRAHARVRVRARRRQRPPGGAGHAGQLSGRDRQRLRGMGRLRQPLLARPLLRRCAGTYPPSSVRRGRVRAVGDDHPAAAVRGGIRRNRSRAGL